MSSNSKSEDTQDFTPDEANLCAKCGYGEWRHDSLKHPCNVFEPPQDTSLDEQLMEVMLYVRTTHEVEHNDNQWAREFVYSFDEAKAKINRLIDDARLDERNKCIRELRGDDE